MATMNERFIRTYEKLAKVMKFREGKKERAETKAFPFAIAKAPGVDAVVKKNASLLTYIRDIRNLLQHPQQASLKPAVVVSAAFLKEAQDLLKYLQDPQTARSVGVSRKQIRTARLDDQIGGLADEMKRHGFTHLPILGKRGSVVGVFNEAAVFNYLWTESEMIIDRDMSVLDILSHCRLDADRTETFQFASPDTSLGELTELFLALDSHTRVGAVFVTDSGKRREPLRRLITAWDVLKTSNKK